MEINFKSTTIEGLSEEMQSIALKAQEEITKKMQEASMSGDMSAITELTAQLTAMQTNLQQAFQARCEQIQNGELNDEAEVIASPYNQDLCSMDLDLAVYDGDRDYFMEFCVDEDIKQAYEQMTKENPESASRKHLLKTSMRLTPTLAPQLYNIGNICKKALGLNVDIEFYVYQDNQFNAACYPPDDKRFYIILTSSILERFSEKELGFVIGHEIGHALFLHHRFPVNYLLNLGEEYLSPLHAMKLFAWKRNAEISADRIGLLCCGDFDAAGSAFFKLSSGVTTASLEFKLNEYISQFSDLEKVISDSEVDPEDWYSTHPFSPLRIKALEVFYQSETFYSLLGKEGGSITEQEMENTIAKMMSLMEPSYLCGESEHGKMIQNFIFWAGFLVSLADGKVEEEEIKALAGIVSPEIYNENFMLVSQHNVDSIKEMLTGMSTDMNNILSIMQKLNIIRDMCVISSSDGEIDNSEVDILYGLAYILNIRGEFVDKVLDEMTSEEE